LSLILYLLTSLDTPICSETKILLAPDQHSKLHVADADASGTSAQGNISPINVEEERFNG
jgi:hypothetical protein